MLSTIALDWEERAIMWETITATALIEAGANVVVMRHPQSVRLTKEAIDELWVKEG